LGNRRLVSWLVAALIALALVFLGVRACVKSPCTDVASTDFPSPDQKRIARLTETYCAVGFGNASDARSVAVRKAGEGTDKERDAFITFDVSPGIVWQDGTHLTITVKGIGGFNKSLHRVEDVEIEYRLSDELTYDEIGKRFAAQEGVRSAERLTGNARERYEAFLRWVKDNTRPR
jgi:hypothetical protein